MSSQSSHSKGSSPARAAGPYGLLPGVKGGVKGEDPVGVLAVKGGKENVAVKGGKENVAVKGGKENAGDIGVDSDSDDLGNNVPVGLPAGYVIELTERELKDLQEEQDVAIYELKHKLYSQRSLTRWYSKRVKNSDRIARSVAQDITKKRTSLRLMEAERDLSNPVKGAGKAGGKAGKAGK